MFLGLYTLPLNSIEAHSCIFNLPTLGETCPEKPSQHCATALKGVVQDSLLASGILLHTTQFFEDHSLSTPQIRKTLIILIATCDCTLF